MRDVERQVMRFPGRRTLGFAEKLSFWPRNSAFGVGEVAQRSLRQSDDPARRPLMQWRHPIMRWRRPKTRRHCPKFAMAPPKNVAPPKIRHGTAQKHGTAQNA